MRFLFALILVSCTFFSCEKDKKNIVDVSKITVDFSVQRFDVDFYKTTKKTLETTKKKYPKLFPSPTTNAEWIAKINDADEQELFAETQKIYTDFSEITTQLTSLFKHIKYYRKEFKAPNITTILTNIDYDNRIVNVDSLLFISLDVYLGKDHEFYGSYPKYIKENNEKNHIVVDVANSIIEKQLLPSRNRTFIGKMIYEGKKMHLLDLYLPTLSDKEKSGYQTEKLEWAMASEEDIWKYFMDYKLLFSTDSKLNQRFLETAPFSKFYYEQDQLSPGAIGKWVGWQIVQSYMKNNNISLQKMLHLDAISILNNSKYKPRK